VSYSGGKDSAVVLDLCHRYFKTVHAFFMYQVSDLSFQEATLRWAEKKYGIEIYRVPHFENSWFYRSGTFCHFDGSVPVVTIRDIYSHVRNVFDCHWIAAGERAKDSVVRGAMIKKSGSVDHTRGRFYPIAYWDKHEVLKYVEHHKLKVSPESRVLGASFGPFWPQFMKRLREHYPDDWARVESAFPLIGASAAAAELYADIAGHKAAETFKHQLPGV
jgi:phosphoadenosine phosphosulfate reductase